MANINYLNESILMIAKRRILKDLNLKWVESFPRIKKKSLLAVVFYLTVTVIYLTEELSENESNLNSWILTILLIHGLSWQYCKWQVKITCAGNSNKMNRIPYLEYCWLGSLSIIKNFIIDSTEKLNLTEHINDINNTLLLIHYK